MLGIDQWNSPLCDFIDRSRRDDGGQNPGTFDGKSGELHSVERVLETYVPEKERKAVEQVRPMHQPQHQPQSQHTVTAQSQHIHSTNRSPPCRYKTTPDIPYATTNHHTHGHHTLSPNHQPPTTQPPTTNQPPTNHHPTTNQPTTNHHRRRLNMRPHHDGLCPIMC